MQRELPRTLYSLSPQMQKEIDPVSYEVLVVFNGAVGLPDDEELAFPDMNLSVLHVQNPTVSPVPAINLGLSHARGELIGVMIDGARMASPGLLINAIRAARLHHKPVIATLGFHLGPDVQMRSIHAGYDQEAEDRLLGSVNWKEDGYRLFQISVFAGSSANGWFHPISESNALFLTRAMWTELGGYDARFASPGGGLVNLDTYKRACALPDSQLIVLLGEGTFHQFHDGIATNSKTSPHELFAEEYLRLRGKSFSQPNVCIWHFGTVSEWALPTIFQPVSASPSTIEVAK